MAALYQRNLKNTIKKERKEKGEKKERKKIPGTQPGNRRNKESSSNWPFGGLLLGGCQSLWLWLVVKIISWLFLVIKDIVATHLLQLKTNPVGCNDSNHLQREAILILFLVWFGNVFGELGEGEGKVVEKEITHCFDKINIFRKENEAQKPSKERYVTESEMKKMKRKKKIQTPWSGSPVLLGGTELSSFP